VVYLARFKQGEGIFTDYLAVTTGAKADHRSR
jgi:hypothetical protein